MLTVCYFYDISVGLTIYVQQFIYKAFVEGLRARRRELLVKVDRANEALVGECLVLGV